MLAMLFKQICNLLTDSVVGTKYQGMFVKHIEYRHKMDIL